MIFPVIHGPLMYAGCWLLSLFYCYITIGCSYLLYSLFMFSVSISSFLLYHLHHDYLIFKVYLAFFNENNLYLFILVWASSSGVRLHHLVDNQIFSYSGACIIFFV